MAVREEDRVDAPDVVRERLRAQIGRRVDEDVSNRVAGERRLVGASVGELDQDRGPRAAVAGIGRAADGAVAADRRHAVRRAGAEEGDRSATWNGRFKAQ